MPSCFAIACESAYSKPDPFLIVVPVTRPFQKPGAGTSKPTFSVPACLVGGASGRAAAAAVTARTTRHAVARSRFTVPSLDRCAGKGECTASSGGGLSLSRDRRAAGNDRLARAARRLCRHRAERRGDGDAPRADHPRERRGRL